MICSLANEMSKTEDVVVCSIFAPTPSDIFWHKLKPTVAKRNLGKTRAGFSMRILWKIVTFIIRGNFDVVNLHGMFYYYILAVFLLHNKVKFFYTVHSDAEKENTLWDRRLFKIKKRFFVKGWMHPITISNVSHASFKNLYNTTSNIIFNGVPRPEIIDNDVVSEYKISDNTKVFIHAGRISEPKNQIILCKVFHRLIDEGHDVVLLIAGSKQSEEIFHKIEKFFSDRIVYLGQRDDIPQLMAYSHAMCLPSIWEGLPVTLLEALSVGCVPICSNVGGIPDVIESGKNGFMSATSSEEDYYMVMREFLTLSQDEVRMIREACKETFTKYDIVNTAKIYMHIYNDEMR